MPGPGSQLPGHSALADRGAAPAVIRSANTTAGHRLRLIILNTSRFDREGCSHCTGGVAPAKLLCRRQAGNDKPANLPTCTSLMKKARGVWWVTPRAVRGRELS